MPGSNINKLQKHNSLSRALFKLLGKALFNMKRDTDGEGN